MKISQNISFSKQLIIYLILVLFVVFFLISLALVNSLEQFINNNAYSQAKAIANNALSSSNVKLQESKVFRKM